MSKMSIDPIRHALNGPTIGTRWTALFFAPTGFDPATVQAALKVAVEAPERDRRAPHSILTLQDAAMATSGDYRHWVTAQGRHLPHTMDPGRGGPLVSSPASVTVIAPT